MEPKRKTAFLEHYLGLKTYTKRSLSSFGTNSVIMYALGPNQLLRKKLIIADVNGDIFKNENDSLKNILNVILNSASLTFLHVN